MSESIRLNINMLNSLLADGSIKIVCEVEYLLPDKTDSNENDNSYIINIYKNILLKEKFPDCVIQGIVKISDCSSETFKGMLEFCYTGNVSESTMEGLCVDLFAISHKYQITNLKIKCEQFMASTIDKDNFVQYCRIIELYGSSILEEACVKYIVANREEFLKKDEGWKNLKSTFPCLTHRLLEKLIAEIDKW
uniref:BTB domain-containing protein n=1 Tax=Meloidogyne enterolobii TaxID=390850 RepID=A0A6V7UNI6_MELEN|nr:unnamed protein product [Meloidogyne enterolobii]